MSTDKTEATRLADALEAVWPHDEGRATREAAAALLRRWPDGEPIGYLPAYELDRLRSGHDGRLRSAKFGPSVLDGDVAVYAAPQDQSERIAAQPDCGPVQYCWLVEHFLGDGTGNSTGHYHTGFVTLSGESRSTTNVYEARRYTRSDAEAVAAQLGATLSGTWRAIEHGFHAPPDQSERIAALEAALEQARGALQAADMTFAENGIMAVHGTRAHVVEALRAIEEVRK